MPDITRLLADSQPFAGDLSLYCTICGAIQGAGDQHRPDCAWRIAREELGLSTAWPKPQPDEQPTVEQQIEMVKSWGWAHVANYHDARGGRDGPDVKRCSHLDVDWCSQRDKGQMLPVFRVPTKEPSDA